MRNTNMIGDIILQKRSGPVGWIISLFTRSDYVHVGIEIEDSQVVHVDFWGKHIVNLCDWDDIIVLTPKMPLLPSKQWAWTLRNHAVNELVRGYSLWYAIKSVFWKNPNDDKVMQKRYHCSGFVSAMYRKIGIDLVPNRSDDATQPQDFLESTLLQNKDLTDFYVNSKIQP